MTRRLLSVYVDGNLVQLYDVPSSGVINEVLNFDCFAEHGPVYATAIDASGKHIGTDTVRTPCRTSIP